jgi:spore germination cell wall hydrolase CwlJ-like protein
MILETGLASGRSPSVFAWETEVNRILMLAAPTAMLLLAGCALAPLSPRECLARAMYFESNRSSEEGMYAVGTVVMNRLADPRYPKSVCGVVGQKNQFAPGVMSQKMREGRPAQLANRVAGDVLAGARHPGVRAAKHFHTAGLRFPYDNMHYVLEAGGNEFYEKR